MRLQNAFKYSGFEASELVSTKTLLLKHYFCRQGILCSSVTITNLEKARETPKETRKFLARDEPTKLNQLMDGQGGCLADYSSQTLPTKFLPDNFSPLNDMAGLATPQHLTSPKSKRSRWRLCVDEAKLEHEHTYTGVLQEGFWGEGIAAIFLGPKSASPPAESLAIFLRRKVASKCDSFAIFREKSVPLRFGWRRGTFATENCGDLRLRFLVLSALGRTPTGRTLERRVSAFQVPSRAPLLRTPSKSPF